jgi:hypothetical protein
MAGKQNASRKSHGSVIGFSFSGRFPNHAPGVLTRLGSSLAEAQPAGQFTAEDLNLVGRLEAQANPLAIGMQHDDRSVAADTHLLSGLPAQYQRRSPTENANVQTHPNFANRVPESGPAGFPHTLGAFHQDGCGTSGMDVPNVTCQCAATAQHLASGGYAKAILAQVLAAVGSKLGAERAGQAGRAIDERDAAMAATSLQWRLIARGVSHWTSPGMVDTQKRV